MPSSVIAHFSYQADHKILAMTFVSGMVYHYLNVPGQIYEKLKRSKSKGIYFNQAIKDHYEFKKISK